MSEPRRSLWPIVAVLVLLPVYPLSTGPVLWVLDQLGLREQASLLDAFDTIYAPLGWVVTLTGTEDVLLRYMYLFVELPI